MLGQFQKGENVSVYYEDGGMREGVIVGTNAETGHDKLLYTIKVGNGIWVGEEISVFTPGVSADDAAEQLSEKRQALIEGARARRAEFDERQRIADEGVEEAEEGEEVEGEEGEEATETAEREES